LIDDAKRFFRYTNIAGMPVSRYTGMLEVKPNGRAASSSGVRKSWPIIKPTVP